MTDEAPLPDPAADAAEPDQAELDSTLTADPNEPTVLDDPAAPAGGESTQTVPPPESSFATTPPPQATTPPPAAASPPPRRRASSWKAGDVVAGLYRVKRILGQGGMGRVYQVLHLGWQVDLAVKTILPGRAELAHLRERFQREAETWVDLGMHPAIAQCYYVREIAGLPHIFIEWVGGGSLKDWIADGRVAPGHWASICDLTIQACDGLAHAHALGVVHRDIKPANFLVTPSGQLKVTDFGLAKTLALEETSEGASPDLAAGGDDSLTLPGQVMGTPSYGAPEQWEESSRVDRRADIYSLGVVLFELCGGRRPFDNPSGGRPLSAELIRRHLQDPAPDLLELNPEVPTRLAALVRRCLRKSPDDRFQHMSELRERLCAVYAAEAGHPHPRAEAAQVTMPSASINNRGASELDLGREAEALASWREALRLEPDHPEATYNEAMLAWDRGEIDDAEAIRRVGALMAGPHAARMSHLLGLIHLQRADAESARRALELASASDAPAPGVLLARARAELALEAWDEASRTLARAAELQPDAALELQRSLRDRRRPARGLIDVPPRSPTGRAPKCLRSQEEAGAVDAVLLIDGWRGVSAGGAGDLSLWDLTNGRRLSALRGHQGPVRALARDPAGNILSGGTDRTIRRWSPAGVEEATLQASAAVTCLAVSPDGHRVAAGGRDRRATVWRLADGAQVADYKTHTESVHAVAWHPDGRLLLGSDALRVCPPSGEVASLPPVQEHGVFSIWADAERCLTGGGDGTIVEWDLERSAPRRTLRGHGDAVLALACDARGRLLSASRDRTVKLWDLTHEEASWTSAAHAGPVTCLALSEDGSIALSGGHDRRLRLWSFDRPARSWQAALAVPRSVDDEVERQHDLRGHLAVARAALDAGEDRRAHLALEQARALPGGDRDPLVRELSALLSARLRPTGLRARFQLHTFSGHRRPVESVTILPGSGQAISGGQDGVLWLWSLRERAAVRSLQGHGGTVTCIAACPTQPALFATGSADRTVRFWDTGESACTRTMNAGAPIAALGFLPGGREVAALTQQGRLRRWSFPDGEETSDLDAGGRVTVGAFGHDGRLCLATGDDPLAPLRLVDARTGRDLRSFDLGERDAPVTAVGFDRSGRLALSCDARGKLQGFDAVGGARVLEAEAPGQRFVATPDGRFLLFTGRRAPPTLFDLAEGRALDALEGTGPAAIDAVGRFAAIAAGTDLLLWELEWTLSSDPQPSLPERLGLRGGAKAMVTRYGLDLATPATRQVKRRSRVGLGMRSPGGISTVEAGYGGRWYLLRPKHLLSTCGILALLAMSGWCLLLLAR